MENNEENDFIVNDYLTIKNFTLVDDKIYQFMKFGQLEDYKKFIGYVDNKKVKGYVCLRDDNIYNMEYLE